MKDKELEKVVQESENSKIVEDAKLEQKLVDKDVHLLEVEAKKNQHSIDDYNNKLSDECLINYGYLILESIGLLQDKNL